MSRIPDQFQAPLLEVFGLLVEGRFDELAADGRMGRVRTDDARRELREYPATLQVPPANLLDFVDGVEVLGSPGEWRIDAPFWTAEEGRSDLELQLTGRLNEDGGVQLEIDGILVP